MRPRTIAWNIILAVLMLSSAFSPLISVSSDSGHMTDRDAAVIPWAMFQKDRGHSGHQAGISKGVMDPYELWDNGMLACLGSTIGDLRGNIVLENVTSYGKKGLQGVWVRGNALQVVEGASGNVMWAFNLPNNVLATPALTDTDSDGRVEIAVVTTAGNASLFEPTITWNGTSYRYDQSSALADRVWSRSIGEAVTSSSISLGDITNDGVEDVLFSSVLKVHALNGTTGARLWNYTVKGQLTGTPVIVPFGQTAKRIAVASYNQTGLQTYIYVMDGNGNHQWNKTYSTTPLGQVETLMPSISAGNLDGDSSQELVVLTPFEAGDGRVRAYELDGTPLWGSPFPIIGQLEASPAIADLDDDGDDDIVVVSWNSSTTPPFDVQADAYAIEGLAGSQIWLKVLNSNPGNLISDSARASPVIGDMNNDTAPDVIVPLYSGMVYALNSSDGEVLWSHNTERAALTSSPALADMDGNGLVDIFIDGQVIAHRIVDLSVVDGDITFDDNLPEEGDTIQISALVYNMGTKNADDAMVRFSDLYDNTISHIGTDTINVTAGGTAEASIQYLIEGGGEHKIVVTLDPDNEVAEYDETNNDATRSISIESHWSLQLSSDQPNRIVDPGQQAVFSVEVKNTGDVHNNIKVAVSSSVPQGWSPSIPTDQVTLAPGQDESILFMITTASSSLGGDYTINLTGTSQNKTSNHDTVSLVVTIRGEYGLRVTADVLQRNINTEGLAVYEINITNIGNSYDGIVLEHNDPVNSSWLFHLSNSRVELGSMEYKIVTLSVKPPFDAPDGHTEVAVVNVTSEGDPTQAASLTFTTRIVVPDIAATEMRFFRKDGVEADGVQRHLIANRTSRVNITVSNLLGNVDRMENVMVEIYIEGTSYGFGWTNVIGSQVSVVPIETSFGIGDHTITACSDSNGFIDETDEANNCIHRTITVKSPESVGPYTVFGTIYWPSGERLIDADVKVTNLRTNESFAVRTDHLGNYSVNIKDLPSGYVEEEMVQVEASNGVTTKVRTFRAYSEDLGKKVDIVLTPEPYDFYIGPQVKIFTEPGQPAIFPMAVHQLGNATNNISISMSGMPDGWSVMMEDHLGEPVGYAIISEGQEYNFTVKVIPPADEMENEAGIILTLKGTSNIEAGKEYQVSLIVGILQVYGIDVNVTGGSALRGETAVFNISITNLGNGEDVVIPSIGDNPLGWPMTFLPDRVNLTYKATKNLLVYVDIPDNASIGKNTVGIRLKFGSNQNLDVPLDVVVMEYDYSFSIINKDLSERDIEPGGVQTFTIGVSNEGNMANKISLVVSGQPSGWSARITDVIGLTVETVDLPVGHSEGLFLEVTAPSETFNTRTVVLNISGMSTKKSTETSFALALLSVKAADLTPEGSIQVEKKRPVDGEEVELSIVVRNIGTAAAQGTIAQFLVDNRSIGQVPIDHVAANGNLTLTLKWKAKEGVHTILVNINPNHTLKESNYGNNMMKLDIIVEDRPNEFSIGMVYLVLLIALIIVLGFVAYRKGLFSGFLAHEDDEEEEDEEGYEDEEDELVEVEAIEDDAHTRRRKGKRPPVGKVVKKVSRQAVTTRKTTVRKKTPAKKTPVKKKGPKVARPWTHHEGPDEYDEEALHEELDKDDGIVRFG